MAKDKKKIIRNRPKRLPLSLSLRSSDSKSSYKNDFYKWSLVQSELLKHGEYAKLDIEHLIEEIESLGRSERRALESYFRVLLIHLLKSKYQPEYKTKSWENSIKVSRYQIRKLLSQNPSLKRELAEIIKDAYYLARLEAATETSLSEELFPERCPWTVAECLGGDKSQPSKKKTTKAK